MARQAVEITESGSSAVLAPTEVDAWQHNSTSISHSLSQGLRRRRRRHLKLVTQLKHRWCKSDLVRQQRPHPSCGMHYIVSCHLPCSVLPASMTVASPKKPNSSQFRGRFHSLLRIWKAGSVHSRLCLAVQVLPHAQQKLDSIRTSACCAWWPFPLRSNGPIITSTTIDKSKAIRSRCILLSSSKWPIRLRFGLTASVSATQLPHFGFHIIWIHRKPLLTESSQTKSVCILLPTTGTLTLRLRCRRHHLKGRQI